MIQVGMKHKESVEVTWEMTAEKLGNEGVIVFSTPEMLSFLEITCRHCVEPHLKEGEGTVGISVDLKHMVLTPIGINGARAQAPASCSGFRPGRIGCR